MDSTPYQDQYLNNVYKYRIEKVTLMSSEEYA